MRSKPIDRLLGSAQIWDRAEFDSFVVGKSVEEVETLIAEGQRFSHHVQAIAEVWVRQQKERQAAASDRAGLELERRAVEASERAAKAAEEAAAAARHSARISVIALLVAAAMAVITAWPMIKNVGRPVPAIKNP